MKYNQYYGGLIWTNHAIERLKQRGLLQEAAWQTFKNPNAIQQVKNGATEFKKRLDNLRISVVAKQNERSEWVVISVWADPPLPGSPDAKRKEEYWKYQKAGHWRKLWLTLLKQLGF